MEKYGFKSPSCNPHNPPCCQNPVLCQHPVHTRFRWKKPRAMPQSRRPKTRKPKALPKSWTCPPSTFSALPNEHTKEKTLLSTAYLDHLLVRFHSASLVTCKGKCPMPNAFLCVFVAYESFRLNSYFGASTYKCSDFNIRRRFAFVKWFGFEIARGRHFCFLHRSMRL